MTIRKLLASLALGLPVALITHAVVYGSSHIQAGDAHGLFLEGAVLIFMATALALLAGACSQAKNTMTGSVLASVLMQDLPDLGPLALCAGGWFTFGESLEAPHAWAPLLVIALAMLGAAFVVRWALHGLARLIATIAITTRTFAYAARMPTLLARPQRAVAHRRRLSHSPRRFVRPPPVAA
ncbi:MAG: hypothetical protein ACYDGW_06785 [Vulcanimicrobiaceae bacterium]